MTEQPQEPAAAQGPNLMILKGVVWGLGVLLILGVILIAVMIAIGPRDTTPVDTLTIPLEEGDRIVSSSFEGGNLVAVIERDGMPHRIMIIDMRTNKTQQIPVERDIP